MSYINAKGFTSEKEYGQLRDLSSQLIIKGSLILTKTWAKKLQTHVEPIVTLAKRGDLSSRRLAAQRLRKISFDKEGKDAVLQNLFDVIAPAFKDRKGGYTRIIKMNSRKGDSAPMVLITFVTDEITNKQAANN